MNDDNIKIQPTVFFKTIGCRLNQYESEKMAADLLQYGFDRVNDVCNASLYIINTCTVTHKADKDSRYFIRKARRDNPDIKVVMVGCYVNHDYARLSQMDEIDILVTNKEKNNLVSILQEKFPELFNGKSTLGEKVNIIDFHEHNRAWVKVSDGCNQKCAYCLVTIVRGEHICKPYSEIRDEINSLAVHGYQEVVLVAVNLGYYKDASASPPIKNLTELVRRLLDETAVYRFRLSSLEPQTVTDDLINLMKEKPLRFCRHFHIPLQSGSSSILKVMRRPYNSDRFLKLVQKIKNKIPECNIGADVIVGFPGETEEDFEQSRQAVDSGFVDYLHVFSFSNRPGTRAFDLPDKVNPKIARKRNIILTEISSHRLSMFMKNQIGKELEVISESKTTGTTHFGVSDNFVKVKMPELLQPGKNVIRLKITSHNLDYLTGEKLL